MNQFVLLQSCGYHQFWRSLLFNMVASDLGSRQDKTPPTTISVEQLAQIWRRMMERNHNESSQLVYLLTRGSRKFVVPEDFVPLVQDVVESHPGLGFLKEATEFHSRYVHTVSFSNIILIHKADHSPGR